MSLDDYKQTEEDIETPGSDNMRQHVSNFFYDLDNDDRFGFSMEDGTVTCEADELVSHFCMAFSIVFEQANSRQQNNG